MSANPFRAPLRRIASCCRYSSTQATAAASSNPKLDVQPKAELPPEKMRALVDLYHHSATFITSANLSAKIDEAFIDRRSTRTKLNPEKSLGSILYDVRDRRSRPKFGLGSDVTPRSSRSANAQKADEWSEHRSPRETQVFTTLHGVYHRAKPGYDALMDELASPRKEEEGEAQQEQEPEGERGSV